MKLVRGSLVALVCAVSSCAPSKDIESPADPPGLEKEDEKQKAEGSGEASVDVEGEAEADSESGD